MDQQNQFQPPQSVSTPPAQPQPSVQAQSNQFANFEPQVSQSNQSNPQPQQSVQYPQPPVSQPINSNFANQNYQSSPQVSPNQLPNQAAPAPKDNQKIIIWLAVLAGLAIVAVGVAVAIVLLVDN